MLHIQPVMNVGLGEKLCISEEMLARQYCAWLKSCARCETVSLCILLRRVVFCLSDVELNIVTDAVKNVQLKKRVS